MSFSSNNFESLHFPSNGPQSELPLIIILSKQIEMDKRCRTAWAALTVTPRLDKTAVAVRAVDEL